MSRPEKKRKVSYALPAAVAVIAGAALLGTQQFQGDDSSQSTANQDSANGATGQAVVATVQGISDGDTIRVRLDGEPERVRILGLDAPEVHTSQDCGGEESWDHLETLLAPGEEVSLISDSSQSFYDQYGRILAYVENSDGTDVGLAQIEAGWARVYRKGSRIELFDDYVAAESNAKSGNLGVWGQC